MFFNPTPYYNRVCCFGLWTSLSRFNLEGLPWDLLHLNCIWTSPPSRVLTYEWIIDWQLYCICILDVREDNVRLYKTWSANLRPSLQMPCWCSQCVWYGANQMIYSSHRQCNVLYGWATSLLLSSEKIAIWSESFALCMQGNRLSNGLCGSVITK